MSSALTRTTAVVCAAALGSVAFVADVVALPRSAAAPVAASVHTLDLAGVDPEALAAAPPAGVLGGHWHPEAEPGEHGDAEHGDAEHEPGEHEPGEHGDAEHGHAEHGDAEHGEHGDAEHGERGVAQRGWRPRAGMGSPTGAIISPVASSTPDSRTESSDAALTELPSGAAPYDEPGTPAAPATPEAPTAEAATSDSATADSGAPDSGAPDSATASPSATPDGAGPEVLTGPLATEDFTVLGVTWDEDSATEGIAIQVRVREDDGWSDWEQLEVSDEGPDAGTEEHEASAEISATVPLVTDDADGLQVRIDTADGEAPEDVEAVLIDPGESAADGTVGTTTPLASAEAALATPTIVSRASWGADESKRRCSPTYSDTIKAATVHHTAGGNSYSRSDSAAIVRGVYAYHTDALGWCDVGYNFLVDKYGRVFEGRYGGITAAVRGAHAGGFNVDTVGVAAIGHYSQGTAPSAMVSAIGKIVGWKLGLYGQSVYGQTTLTSAGGGTARYSAGTKVRLNRVMGHQDVGSTSCPGGDLYAKLTAVRSAGKAYQTSPANRAASDLAVVAANAGGAVEVHVQGRSTAYGQRSLARATGLSGKDATEWRFFLGPVESGGAPDLIAVHVNNTTSGKVEVEVWSYASNYQDKVLDVVTPMHDFTPDRHWHVTTAPNKYGQSDLLFLTTKGGGGYTEIHGLSAYRDYGRFNLHRRTGLKRSFPDGAVQFLFDDRRNLFWVQHEGTGSGRTEVHILSASSGHRRHVLHAASALGEVDGSTWRFGLADYNRNGRQDLHVVRLRGATKLEVHVLSRTTKYRTWLLHKKTDLPKLTYPAWQVDMT